MNILRRLSTGEAMFKELNEAVANTRTLTRRLKALRAEYLLRKIETSYRITEEDFEATLGVTDVEGGTRAQGMIDG